MVMIQDSNKPSESDKPLRITGDPMKCQVSLLNRSYKFHNKISWYFAYISLSPYTPEYL